MSAWRMIPEPNASTDFEDTCTFASQEPVREVAGETLLPQSVGNLEAARAAMWC
jgi:hypothetical protein